MRTKKSPAKVATPGRLNERISLALLTGYWFCNDCERVTERIEGEQGQPAHCYRCGSHRIAYQKPILPDPYETELSRAS